MTGVTFTKLFSSITESTVWCENDQVRIVWITMLAMANKNGYVFGSIPGLANRARVSVESCREAIAKFQQPDPDSRTKDFDGRRIEEVDGGWRLLNYAKHRAIRDEEERREYMKNLMRQRRSVSHVSRSKPSLSQAEADSREQKAEVSNSKSLGASAPKRATRIPEYFVPSEAHYELAKELGINCEMEFQKFRDYFLGVSGQKGTKLDWDATLRNWLKNSVSYRRGNNDNLKTKAQLRNERSDELIDRIFREVEPAEDLSENVRKRT